MKGLTLAQIRAARDSDEVVVDAVRRRLTDDGALEALTHLSGLSRDELALLAAHERQASEPLPMIPALKAQERKAS